MGCAGRTIVAATFVLSSVTHAQESGGDALVTAKRDAVRYVACWLTPDTRCMQDLTDVQVRDEVGPISEGYRSYMLEGPPRLTPRISYYSYELAAPWGPFSTADRLVTIVPYFDTAIDDSTGQRREGMGYLIASSYDSGQSWRFVKVEQNTPMLEDWMDRLIPGAADPQWPGVGNRLIQEPELERSRSLRTTARSFVQADDGFSYVMKWEVRSEITDAAELLIRYDDPADRSRPLIFQGLLHPGKNTLDWTSPVLTGFESGQLYDVVVEASDPDTGEILFEHTQSLLFQPTFEMWKAEMSKPPAEQTN